MTVYTRKCTLIYMKNITLSAQDEVIDELRQLAQQKNVTVNELFRRWANEYVSREKRIEHERRLKALQRSWEKISFTSERKYTREEMNER